MSAHRRTEVIVVDVGLVVLVGVLATVIYGLTAGIG